MDFSTCLQLFGGSSAAFVGIKTVLVRAVDSLALLPNAPAGAPSNPEPGSEQQNERQAQLQRARMHGLEQASWCISILDRLSIVAAGSSSAAADLLTDWGRHGLLEALVAALRTATRCAELGSLPQLDAILRFVGEHHPRQHRRLFQSIGAAPPPKPAIRACRCRCVCCWCVCCQCCCYRT
jgi:hypothetical protein